MVDVSGRVDMPIHNAGWVAYEPIAAIRKAAFDRMMAIAVKASL